jgi:hypothetical protein
VHKYDAVLVDSADVVEIATGMVYEKPDDDTKMRVRE